MMARTIDELCEIAHTTYETAAAAHGWETQKRSRVAWADLPEENKAAMRAMMIVLRDEIRARAGCRVHRHRRAGADDLRVGVAVLGALVGPGGQLAASNTEDDA